MKFLVRYLLILLTAIGLQSCRGLIEHIREAQQQGRDQNESSYRVVFSDEDPHKKPDRGQVKKPRKPRDTKPEEKKDVYTTYEKKWNITLNGNEDIALLEEIDSWLGTPYKYGGKAKDGTDCSGMVLTIYKKLYNIDAKRSAYDLWQQSSVVKRDHLQCGDLVFFKINMKQVSHVGIYIANGYFVHASSSRGVIIDQLGTKYYDERFGSGGRLKK